MYNRILLPLDRSALARVMLQTPQLIVFDEATSLWDNTNEVMSATKGLFQDFLQQKANRLTCKNPGTVNSRTMLTARPHG